MTEAAVPDHIEALRAFLLADTGVTAAVSGRVFGGELPGTESKQMPRAAIVLRMAGGGTMGSAYQRYGDQRVDVRCYGATPKAASDLWRLLYPALKQLRRHAVEGCFLHWAKRSGGPMPLRDPDTDWPFVFGSFQVMVGEVAV